jgi:Divergent PAP2 family
VRVNGWHSGEQCAVARVLLGLYLAKNRLVPSVIMQCFSRLNVILPETVQEGLATTRASLGYGGDRAASASRGRGQGPSCKLCLCGGILGLVLCAILEGRTRRQSSLAGRCAIALAMCASRYLRRVFPTKLPGACKQIFTKRYKKGVWDLRAFVDSGGMPSSHSSLCMAVTTALALQFGLGSALFAASLCFSLIVMYDACNVRQHAGGLAELGDEWLRLHLVKKKLFLLQTQTPWQGLQGN